MRGYYSKGLSGDRLRRCYEIASPRIKQYLEAEIRHVAGRLRKNDSVLELGCGYGRVAFALAESAARVVGVDTSIESIELARRIAGAGSRCEFIVMDAIELAFDGEAFDTVVCVQNGICAFGVDKEALVREALRVTRPGGLVLFSSYAAGFWPHRLEWFEAQAAEGLVGEIDHERTQGGVIVCKDGFEAGQMSPGDFERLARRLSLDARVREVDRSSVFLEIRVAGGPERVKRV